MGNTHFFAMEPAGAGGAAADFDQATAVALDELNQRVAGADGLDEVLGLTARLLGEVAPCDRYAVAILDDDGRLLVSRAAWTAYKPILLDVGYAAEFAGGSLEGVVERRQIRVIDDLAVYAAEHPGSASSALLLSEGVRSSMTCPLLVDGRVAGVFFRSSRRPRAYCGRDIAVQLAIAGRLAQTVEKLWRIQQLAAANRNYLETLAFVAHELKSPVSGMVIDAETAAAGYLGEIPERALAQFGKIAAKGRILLGMVGDFLNLARIEGGDLACACEDGVDPAAAVIAPAMEMLEPLAAERGTSVEVDFPTPPLAIRCDQGLLRIVATNLIGNAIKYGLDSDGKIKLTLRGENGEMRFSVWNAGPGFSAENRPKLFKRFSRLAEPELKKRKGTGVGLYTCWRLVRMHGGTIEADSQPGQWAEFTVVIPMGGPTNPPARKKG